MTEKQRKILVIFPAAVFVISLCFWILNKPKTRYVLFFESFDKGRQCLEERYLPHIEKEKRLQVFVNELLLGSQNPRCKLLFPKGTRSLFCFFDGGTLFINLSGDIVKSDGAASEINAGFDLLRKNILHNFKYVKKIEIFADNKEIF
ncbi:GerMN domain-containing protein [Treponema parvum]|uniref:GerMN domain-containing protein n=1 Tax=Treponema parvum TaxID=138851 RepID=UPI001AEBE0ED|nr:GerMN domain-containing protein [Treponema parvum]QTQ16071.1 GerMN domain-containing protein [Treponema parvum]